MSNGSKLDSNHDKVLEIFHHRCVRCGRPSEIVHEIVPRSRRPKTWMDIDNRVVLCVDCHDWAHHRGAKTSAKELNYYRIKRIIEYARTDRSGSPESESLSS